jgi:hypothetical protein
MHVGNFFLYELQVDLCLVYMLESLSMLFFFLFMLMFVIKYTHTHTHTQSNLCLFLAYNLISHSLIILFKSC